MALKDDIYDVFNAMTGGAQDDDWMCSQLNDIIVDYASSATITTSDCMGTFTSPAGDFKQTGSAIAKDGWEISSPDLQTNKDWDDDTLAQKWGDAIDGAISKGECHFETIAGSVSTQSGPSPGKDSGTGKPTNAAAGTIESGLKAIFAKMKNVSDEGAAEADDEDFANEFAKAITATFKGITTVVTCDNNAVTGSATTTFQ